ncbi:hypothetical protein BBB39_09195 [Bordetella trematum]|uniref:Phage protein n=1 Tax=Bordetella trematum TaxID=123899 RepID=A0A157SPB8_9BORD|nr:hypothetical protein [Bordetella trematum]AZR93926.1 hypothetical protein BBB39_09195 [Bordetella trematum]NNH19058.1 hypothetical protein [Bordetella trematum]SAI43037.1 Uncharacterised protein [Bordetella trematum]SAI72225.1 Uncharacterised protein [Bordetella trematum]SUV97924.1 Uncharacterised protein [Bordetella trematum]
MSTFDYAEMAATAQELLEEFGGPVTLRQIETGEYDPALGQAPSTETDSVGVGVLFDYTAQAAGIANLSGSVIETGDKQLYLAPEQAAGGPMPAARPADLVLALGATWRVVSVKALAPTGAVLLYEIQLRR